MQAPGWDSSTRLTLESYSSAVPAFVLRGFPPSSHAGNVKRLMPGSIGEGIGRLKQEP